MTQVQTAIEESFARPLTTLSEDEQMFRDSVREFAEGEIRKRVEEMDEQAHIDPALIKQCFEIGLMGIETAEGIRRRRRLVLPGDSRRRRIVSRGRIGWRACRRAEHPGQ
jgi:alkylation response protein AidB-like acyl-CoA dehydrogenase